MKIFFFSTVFAPSIGGIEQLAQTLCAEFVAMGHEVRLATMTPGDGTFAYPVIRRPSIVEFLRLLRWCDVHVQANIALKHAWPRLLFPRKFVYRYANAYQRDDGSRDALDWLKVALARHSCGIANSHYTAARTGARHVVLNAYGDAVFRTTRPWAEREGDLVFLGRLVSQKGCDTLLDALGRLRQQGLHPNLAVIGDGPDRPALQEMCQKLGIAGQVRFLGTLQGSALATELNRHRVMVVPSRYEEPFGIVALEGLACGCLPVVSERGGLVDATGGHGLTFPNRDAAALARALAQVLQAPDVARARLDGVEQHLARCSARAVAKRYLEIFRQHTGAN
jgi:glycogen synthase